MRVQTLIGLILCNLIWSMHPVMGKILLMHFTPPEVAWVRYVSALIAFWVGAWVMGLKKGFRWKQYFCLPRKGSDWIWIVLLGVMAFCFSPYMQILGLAHTLATENAIIISMEPLVTALLAWMILKEKVTPIECIAFGLAFFGFIFLNSTYSGTSSPAVVGLSHSTGNSFILLSLLGEALYSILGRKLTARHSPLALFGTALTIGVGALAAIGVYLSGFQVFVHLAGMNWKPVLAILWMGPLGTTAGYLYAMYVLSEVPVMSVVFLLFLQPLAGSFFGYLILDDQLKAIQWVGGGLILLAVILPLYFASKKTAHSLKIT